MATVSCFWCGHRFAFEDDPAQHFCIQKLAAEEKRYIRLATYFKLTEAQDV